MELKQVPASMTVEGVTAAQLAGNKVTIEKAGLYTSTTSACCATSAAT